MNNNGNRSVHEINSDKRRTAKRNNLKIILLLTLLVAIIASIFIFSPKKEDQPSGLDVYLDGETQTAQNNPVRKPGITNENLERQNFTIVVDPGHGYDDPGTGEGYLFGTSEKEIVLDISMKIRDILTRKGFSVVLTREDDIKPRGTENEMYMFNPAARIEFVEALPDYDLFVSVHCDSFESDFTVEGTRIYYFEENTAFTDDYAEKLSEAIFSRLPSKEPRIISMNSENAYHVLKGLTVPSCLVEIGFVTNITDRANMLDEEWKQKMAEGIAEGVEKFWQENQ